MTENQWNDEDTTDVQAEGKVPDAVRADIAGEPGPANPELREKALDPNEASVDVADDPNAAGVHTAYEDGAAVDPDEESGDPDAQDTGDFAAVPPEEQAEADDDTHPQNVNEPVDVSDVTDDGQVVDVTGEDQGGAPA